MWIELYVRNTHGMFMCVRVRVCIVESTWMYDYAKISRVRFTQPNPHNKLLAPKDTNH